MKKSLMFFAFVVALLIEKSFVLGVTCFVPFIDVCDKTDPTVCVPNESTEKCPGVVIASMPNPWIDSIRFAEGCEIGKIYGVQFKRRNNR